MSSKSEIARHAGQYPAVSPDDQARYRAQDRARRIRLLQLTLLGLLTLDEAARALQVQGTTLDRWKRELLTDGQPDTDDLRKLSHARKHGSIKSARESMNL